jgi:hypothetical protein
MGKYLIICQIAILVLLTQQALGMAAPDPMAPLAPSFVQDGTLLDNEEKPPDSNLVKAVKSRISELQATGAGTQFEFKYICDGRIGVVFPVGHDLMLYLPTLGGASTKKIALEEAFQKVFDWLESDYMLPTDPNARKASASGTNKKDPLVILVLNRISERNLFNVRFSDGAILEKVIRASLLPYDHEDCIGVPCSYPGSCGDNLTCSWETHVPLCQFINQGTAELMLRRYGKLPQAFLGFSEILEVAVTGGHYAYRNRGDENLKLPHSERDGYALEFSHVLKKQYSKKKHQREFLIQLLGWKGGHFSTEYSASCWGMAQVLLGHLKTSGKGADKRTLGDLLFEIGHLEEATPEEVLKVLEEYDSNFLATYKKTVSKKLLKGFALLH